MPNLDHIIYKYKTLFTYSPFNKPNRIEETNYDIFYNLLKSLNSIISNIESDIDIESDNLNKFMHYYTKLSGEIFHDYKNLVWHQRNISNPQYPYFKVGTFELLHLANNNGDLGDFFNYHYYCKFLLHIDRLLQITDLNNRDSAKNFLALKDELEDFLLIFNNEQVIKNQIAIELINLKLNSDSCDEEFLKKAETDLYNKLNPLTAEIREKLPPLSGIINTSEDSFNNNSLLATFISDQIPEGYYLKKGYNKFPWRDFKTVMKDYAYRVSDTVEIFFSTNSDRINTLFIELRKLLIDINEYELGIKTEEEITIIDATFIKTQAAFFKIPAAIEVINFECEILNNITDLNPKLKKLAILRAITAIGEAFFQIKNALPEEFKDNIFIKLRDILLHKSFELNEFINHLIQNNTDNTLLETLEEILSIADILPQLDLLSNNIDHRFEFDIPDYDRLNNLYENFASKQLNDISTFQLSDSELTEVNSLLKTAKIEPITDEELELLKKFLSGEDNYNKQKFIKLCSKIFTIYESGKTGAKYPKKKVNDLHLKLAEIVKVNKHLEYSDDELDFSKIELQWGGTFKDDFKKYTENSDKAGLRKLLKDYKKDSQIKVTKLITSIGKLITSIDGFLEKLSNIQDQDITPLLTKISDFFLAKDNELHLANGNELEIILGVLFDRDSAAYKKLTEYSQVIITKERKQVKDLIIKEVDYVIAKFIEIQEIIESMPPDFSAIDANHHATIQAAEFLYLSCANELKSIQKNLDSHSNNSDLKFLLKFQTIFRNSMAHFNEVFQIGCNVELSSFIKNYETIRVSLNGLFDDENFGCLIKPLRQLREYIKASPEDTDRVDISLLLDSSSDEPSADNSSPEPPAGGAAASGTPADYFTASARPELLGDST